MKDAKEIHPQKDAERRKKKREEEKKRVEAELNKAAEILDLRPTTNATDGDGGMDASR